MAINDSQARAALERRLSRSFTQAQWDLLVAQGYEQAILSGQRTVEDVARELTDLVTHMNERTSAAEPSGQDMLPVTPHTWEEMEKLVLGRTLLTGGTTRPRQISGHGSGAGAGVDFGRGLDSIRRTASGRGEAGMSTQLPIPSRRRWWIWALAALVVVAALAALLYVYVLSDKPAPTTTTTAPTAVTTTTAPPETTTSSTTTSSTTTSSTTTTTVDLTPSYVAQLSGANVVPAVESDASGTLTLTVSEDGESVDYIFEVSGLSDLTIARLRVAEAGASGDEIFTIYPGPIIPGPFSGVVVEGSFTAAQFLGPLAGKTIADLVALLEAGSVYLNVGSATHRTGELRGQLE